MTFASNAAPRLDRQAALAFSDANYHLSGVSKNSTCKNEAKAIAYRKRATRRAVRRSGRRELLELAAEYAA